MCRGEIIGRLYLENDAEDEARQEKRRTKEEVYQFIQIGHEGR